MEDSNRMTPKAYDLLSKLKSPDFYEELATNGVLTPREEVVLKMRFGVENGKNMTLKEVGKRFNVTMERIRQIEAKALCKIGNYLYTCGVRLRPIGNDISVLFLKDENEEDQKKHM